MFHLMKLEIKKQRTFGYIISMVIIVIALCLFSTIAIYGSEQDHNNDFFAIYKLVNACILEVIAIYSSIVMAKTVIEEYSKRTIMIMFSYPILREKLVLAKILLVSIYTMCCVGISNTCCIIYLQIFDGYTNMIKGSMNDVKIENFIIYIITGLIMSGFFSQIPFCIGMLKKSVSATIVSSFGVVCLIQLIISQSINIQQYICTTAIACIVIVILTIIIFCKKINNLDE